MNAINTQNGRTAWLNTATLRAAPGALGPEPRARYVSPGERHVNVGSALGDVHHGLLREPDDRSGRCRGDRTQLAGPARHLETARPGPVLRVAGARPGSCARRRGRARRPLSRACRSARSGRGAPVAELADHRHRPHRGRALAGRRAPSQVTSDQHLDRPQRRTRTAGTRTGCRSSSPSGRSRCSSRCSSSSRPRPGSRPRAGSSASPPCVSSARPLARSRVIAAVEACVAAFGGVAVGFALFFLFRPDADERCRSPVSRSPPVTSHSARPTSFSSRSACRSRRRSRHGSRCDAS